MNNRRLWIAFAGVILVSFAVAALFGVYGMLGMGLMLFCLRSMTPGVPWKEETLRFAFWSINLGLLSMVTLSLLPVGLMQTWASVEHGYWYARSAEFLHTPVMETLRWLRVPGDTLFAIGAIALAWFVARQTPRSTHFHAPMAPDSLDSGSSMKTKNQRSYG